MPDERKGAEERVKGIIAQIRTASKEEVKALIASAKSDIKKYGLDDLLAELEAAVLENIKLQKEIESKQSGAINNNELNELLERIRLRDEEKAKTLEENRSFFKTTFNETNELIKDLDNKDLRVSGKAFKTLLDRNNKDDVDKLGNKFVNTMSILDEKVDDLEKLKNLMGGTLTPQHATQLQDLNKERINLEKDVKNEFKQRIAVQAAAEITKQLVEKGLPPRGLWLGNVRKWQS